MSIKRFRASSQIRLNIAAYLNREFINNGMYFNINNNYKTVYGDRADILKRVNGKLYESLFDKWIYETDGSGISSYNTIFASGVYIDNVFHAKDSSPYKPQIDYNKGRVRFEGTSVSSSATVRSEFSYKKVNIDFPESNIVNAVYSLAKDNSDYYNNSFPSGIQRQLPIVIIDLQNTEYRPWQLGGGKIQTQRIVFHVLANSDNDIEAISDMLSEGQYRKVIIGVDYNKAPQIFNSFGDYASSYKNYSQLQASGAIGWSKIYIDDAKIISKDRFFNLKRARIDWRVRTYLPPGD